MRFEAGAAVHAIPEPTWWDVEAIRRRCYATISPRVIWHARRYVESTRGAGGGCRGCILRRRRFSGGVPLCRSPRGGSSHRITEAHCRGTLLVQARSHIVPSKRLCRCSHEFRARRLSLLLLPNSACPGGTVASSVFAFCTRLRLRRASPWIRRREHANVFRLSSL